MFQGIIAAVDGSPHADRTIRVAAELAKHFGIEVIVVHVTKTITSYAGMGAGSAEGIDEAVVLGRPGRLGW